MSAVPDVPATEIFTLPHTGEVSATLHEQSMAATRPSAYSIVTRPAVSARARCGVQDPVGGGGDPGGNGSGQGVDEVGDVHDVVDQRATTGKLRFGEPRSGGRQGAVVGPADREHPAEQSGVVVAPQPGERGGEADRERHHEAYPVAGRRRRASPGRRPRWWPTASRTGCRHPRRRPSRRAHGAGCSRWSRRRRRDPRRAVGRSRRRRPRRGRRRSRRPLTSPAGCGPGSAAEHLDAGHGRQQAEVTRGMGVGE